MSTSSETLVFNIIAMLAVEGAHDAQLSFDGDVSMDLTRSSTKLLPSRAARRMATSSCARVPTGTGATPATMPNPKERLRLAKCEPGVTGTQRLRAGRRLQRHRWL